MAEQYAWVSCTIENSGFDSERRFEVNLGGDGLIVGTAYVGYLRHKDGRQVEEGEPPYEQKIEGEVQCRVLRREGKTLFVAFPGTEVFHVPQEAIYSQR